MIDYNKVDELRYRRDNCLQRANNANSEIDRKEYMFEVWKIDEKIKRELSKRTGLDAFFLMAFVTSLMMLTLLILHEFGITRW